MIDPFKRCLTDRITLETFPTETILSSVFSVIPSVNPGYAGDSTRKADHEDNDYAHLWTQFPEVTEPSLDKVVTMTTLSTLLLTVNQYTQRAKSYTAKRRCRWKNNSDSGKQKRSLNDVTLIGHHRYML